MTPLSFNPFMRSRLIFERSRADSAAASWASSWRVSRWTSTSPARTACPESKKIFSTMPGWSALTLTPWTAVAVPIDFTVDDHTSCRATVVVTASGGGLNAAPCAMAPFTWWALYAASAPTKAATMTSISIIRLIMRTRLSLFTDSGGYGFPGRKLLPATTGARVILHCPAAPGPPDLRLALPGGLSQDLARHSNAVRAATVRSHPGVPGPPSRRGLRHLPVCDPRSSGALSPPLLEAPDAR